MRRAAFLKASERISQLLRKRPRSYRDAMNTESIQQKSEILGEIAVRIQEDDTAIQKLADRYPKTCQILTTQRFIRECMAEMELHPDQKVEWIIKLCQHLTMFPMMLLLHPEFRTVMMTKLDEFEETAQEQKKRYEASEFEKKIHVLRSTLYQFIDHAEIVEQLQTLLRSIQDLQRLYRANLGMSSLQLVIDELRTVIRELPDHPDYAH